MINPLFLILQSISGGVAGYITNKYAVNMLFKEYTPLKLGGVVKKNKEKFIDEVSTLVEKDIINGSTLKEHISGEMFKKEINIVVEKFWNEGLKDAFKDLKIKDIESFEESKKSFLEFTEDKIKIISEEALNNLLKNIDMKKLLSKDQISHIVNSVYDVLVKYLKENRKFEELLNSIYEEQSNLLLGNVVNNDLENSIKDKVKNILLEALENVFNDKDKLSAILQEIYDLIEIDKVIHKLFEEINQKSINEYLSKDEKNNISKKIYLSINDLLNSEKGIEVINFTLIEILKIVENLDFTLFDLLSEETSINFSKFIEEITAKILPSIAQWILFNKNEVNNMIEESIDSSIGGMDGAIKRIIIQKVRESLFSDISEKASIVERIVSYIEGYELNEESSKKVAEFIINYLKENKVKDVVEKLRQSNIISEDKIKLLHPIIAQKFNLYGERIINTIIEQLCNKKIGTFINDDKVSKLIDVLKTNLTILIINNKTKILINVEKIIVKIIEVKSNELLQSNLKTLIAEEDYKNIANKSNSSLDSLLSVNKDKIVMKIEDIITNKIETIDLMQVINSKKEVVNEALVKLVVEFEESIINKYSDNNVNEFINAVAHKEKLIELSNDKVYRYLNENIEVMLNGNVKKIIYDNLIRFDEDEICDLAQSFMGNELKPLSLFGGILGLVVGFIYGLFVNNNSILGFSNSVGATILSCLMMALIGVSTNVIALKMLFYPYKRNKFLAKIPFLRKFSLGYIPAHKETMARSVGKVIDEQLLNGEKVEVILNSKKDMFKGYLISSIAESNYKVIVDNLAIRKNSILDYIYVSIKNNIEKNKEKLASDIAKTADSISVENVIKENIVLEIAKKIKKQHQSIEEKLVTYIEEKLNSSRKCEEVVSSIYEEKIKGLVQGTIEDSIYNNLVKLIEEENIFKVLCTNEEQYKLLINNSLNKILKTEESNEVQDLIRDKIMKFIFEDSKLYLEDLIAEFLKREIQGEKTIGSILGGNVASYIDLNIPKLSKYLISKAENYLKNNKEHFSTKIRLEITSSLNFLERGAYMMFGGDDIVNRCVDTMVDIKVPVFLDNKYLEITSVVQNTLTYSIYPTPISELKLKVNEINCSRILESIFVSLNNSPELKLHIDNRLNEIIMLLFNKEISEFLYMVDLDSVKGILNKFNYEIKFILKEIQSNIEIKKSELESLAYRIINEEIIKYLKNTSINELTDCINREQIMSFVNSIFREINKDESINIKIENILSDLYSKEIKDKSLSAFINKQYVSQYGEEYIENVFNDREFNNCNIDILSTIFDEIIKNQLDFINDDTKDDLICKVIDGVLEAVSNNTSMLLKAANLKRVTMEQIAIMEPKEIHMLFEGFAGEFFKKLYIYGSFGAIFGINLWLSIIWGIVEEINNKRAV